MNLTDKGFLDSFLDVFKSKCIAGIDLLTPEVYYLLFALGTIEIVLCCMLNHDGDKFHLLIKRFLKIMFFYYLIENWENLAIEQVFETFKMAGIVATGADSFLLTPSEIIGAGITLTTEVLKDIVGISGWLALFSIGSTLMKILFFFLILAAFAFMAIQLFLATVEFYIMTTISLVLLPFGINKHLGFLSEKAIGAVFSAGIKIMTLQFVLGISWVFAKDWATINVGTDMGVLVQTATGACTLAFLIVKAPDLAQGLLSGSPSLSGGEAINMGKQGANTALGAATGGTSRVLQMAGTVMQATKSTDGRSGVGNFAGNLKTIGLTNMRKHNPYTQARLRARGLINHKAIDLSQNSLPKKPQSQETDSKS